MWRYSYRVIALVAIQCLLVVVAECKCQETELSCNDDGVVASWCPVNTWCVDETSANFRTGEILEVSLRAPPPETLMEVDARFSLCESAAGVLVQPPSYRYLAKLFGDFTCFYVNARHDVSIPAVVWDNEMKPLVPVSLGNPSSSGPEMYSCGLVQCTNTDVSVMTTALCDVAKVQGGKKAVAYSGCSRSGIRTVWKRRRDTVPEKYRGWEDIAMPYGATRPTASRICNAMGGYLGTPMKTYTASRIIDEINSRPFSLGRQKVHTGVHTLCDERQGRCSVEYDDGTLHDEEIHFIPSDVARESVDYALALTQRGTELVPVSETEVLPFTCSRELWTVVALPPENKCYVGFSCTVVLSIQGGKVADFVHTDTSDNVARWVVEYSGAMEKSSPGIMQMLMGESTSSLTFKSSVGGRATMSFMMERGFGFAPVSSIEVGISPLEAVVIEDVPSTIFVGESIIATLRRSSFNPVVPRFTGTLKNVSVVAFPTKSLMTSIVLEPVDVGKFTIHFELDGSTYEDSTDYFEVNVEKTYQLAVSMAPADYIVNGEVLTISITLPQDVTSLFGFTVDIFADEEAVLGKAQFRVSEGDQGKQSVLIRCNSSSTNPTLVSFTASTDARQFTVDKTLGNVVVRPRIPLQFQVETATMTIGESYDFRVYAEGLGLYGGTELLVEPNCGEAMFTPPKLTLSTDTETGFFSVRSTNVETCSVVLGQTGPFTSRFTWKPVSAILDFVNKLVITASLSSPSTTLFVGESFNIDISFPSGEMSDDDRVNISIGWDGGDGILSKSFPEIASMDKRGSSWSMEVQTLAPTTGNVGFGFMVSAPEIFSSNISPLMLTVLQLVEVKCEFVADSQSIGEEFAEEVKCSVPYLPGSAGQYIELELILDDSVFAISPSRTARWTNRNSSTSITFQLVALKAVGAVDLAFTTTGTARELERVSEVVFKKGLYVYERISLSMTPMNIVHFGNSTFSVRLNLDASLQDESHVLPFFVKYPADEVRLLTADDLVISSRSEPASELLITFEPLQMTNSEFDLIIGLDLDRVSREVLQWYNTTVLLAPIVFRIQDYAQVDLQCERIPPHKGGHYFSPENIKVCAVSIPQNPQTGTVEFIIAENKFWNFNVTQLTLSVQPLFFNVTPKAEAVPLVTGVTDTLPKVDVVSSSSMYRTYVLQGKWAVLPQLRVDVFVQGLEPIFVGEHNPFILRFEAASLEEAEPLGIALGNAYGLHFQTEEVSLSVEAPSAVVTAYAEKSGSFEVVFLVRGSTKFTDSTSTSAIFVLPLINAHLTVRNGGDDLFVGSSYLLELEVDSPPGKGVVEFSLSYECLSSASGETVFIELTEEKLSLSLMETTRSTRVNARAGCSKLQISARRAEASDPRYSTDPAEVQVVVLSQAEPTATLEKTNIFGGGDDFAEFEVNLHAAPRKSISITVTEIQSSRKSTTVLEISPSSITLDGSTTSHIFEISSKVISDSVVSSSVQLSLSGPSLHEYSTTGVEAVSFTIRIQPVTPIVETKSIPGRIVVGEDNAIVYELQLPRLPQGGYIVLTPKLYGGSPDSVRITPTSHMLSHDDSIEVLNAPLRFTITALVPTVGEEYITTEVTGTAVEYVPQDLRHWPVTCASLGIVAVGEIPKTVFLGAQSVIVATISAVLAEGETVILEAATDDGLRALPSSITWSAGDSDPKTISLSGTRLIDEVSITFVLTSPTTFQQYVENDFSTISVKDERSIVINLPSYIYVGIPVMRSISIQQAPEDVDGVLTILPTIDKTFEAVVFSQALSFTQTSSLSQELSITGQLPAEEIKVSFSLLGSAASNYDPPHSQSVEVLDLEQIIVEKIPYEMYEGNEVTIILRISQMPGTFCSTLNLVPSFGTSDATIQPSGGVTFTAGSNELKNVVLLSSVFSTPSAVSFRVTKSGDCAKYFSTPQLSSESIRIHPKDQIFVGFGLQLLTVDDEEGREAYVGYVNDEIPVEVFVEEVAIPYESITGTLKWSGGHEREWTISGDSDSVILRNTVKDITKGYLTLTLSDASAKAFVPPEAYHIVIVERVPIMVNFDTGKVLLVAGVTVRIVYSIPRVALSGPVKITCSYSQEEVLEFSSVELSGSILSAQSTWTPIRPSAGRGLISCRQEEHGGYAFQVDAFDVAIVPQQQVKLQFVGEPHTIFLGDVFHVRLTLSALPTRDTEVVEIVIPKYSVVEFSTLVVRLSKEVPSVMIAVSALVVGTVSLGKGMLVRSIVTDEFAPAIAAFTKLEVVALLQIELRSYEQSMFVDEEMEFSVKIPQFPASGKLTVTPEFTLPDGYLLPVNPSFVIFDNPDMMEETMVIQAPSMPLAPTKAVFKVEGSSEFEPFIQDTIRVDPSNKIVISEWIDTVFVGEPNSVSFILSIKVPPSPQFPLRVWPVVDAASPFSVNPSSVEFTSESSMTAVLALTGLVPSEETLFVSFSQEGGKDFYQAPLPVRLEIRNLVRFDTHMNTNVVFGKRMAYATLIALQSVPSTIDVTIILLQNRTMTSQVEVGDAEMIVEPLSKELTLARGATEVQFGLQPLVTPLVVDVSFEIAAAQDGSGNLDKYSLSTPTKQISFLRLRAIQLQPPVVAYRGLPALGSLRIEQLPGEGESVTVRLLSETSFGFNQTTFIFTSASSSKSMFFELMSQSTGRVSFYTVVAATGTTAYDLKTVPSLAEVDFQEPKTLSLSRIPERNYIGKMNYVVITVTVGVLEGGEEVTLELWSPSEAIIITPTKVVLSHSSDISRVHFSIWSEEVVSSSIHLRFTSTSNRFLLDERLMEDAGVQIDFSHLLVPSAELSYSGELYIGREFSIMVTLPELPANDRILSSYLTFSGSPSTISVRGKVRWTAETRKLRRTLFFTGVSRTDLQTLVVNFEGDTHFDLSTKITFPIRFLPLRQINVVEWHSTAFVGEKRPLTFSLSPTDVKIRVVLTVSPSNVAFLAKGTDKPVENGGFLWLTGSPSVQGIDVGYRVGGTCTVSFEIQGENKWTFIKLPSAKVTVLSHRTLLVNSPQVLTIYEGLTKTVTVEVSKLPEFQKTLRVVPELSCSNGDRIASFEPPSMQFKTTTSQIQQFFVSGVVPFEKGCEVKYPISGDTTGYNENGQQFTIRVKSLVNVTLDAPNEPIDLFLGPENEVGIRFVIDPSAELPFPDSTKIVLASSSPCVAVNPSVVSWAPNNPSDSLKKRCETRCKLYCFGCFRVLHCCRVLFHLQKSAPGKKLGTHSKSDRSSCDGRARCFNRLLHVFWGLCAGFRRIHPRKVERRGRVDRERFLRRRQWID